MCHKHVTDLIERRGWREHDSLPCGTLPKFEIGFPTAMWVWGRGQAFVCIQIELCRVNYSQQFPAYTKGCWLFCATPFFTLSWEWKSINWKVTNIDGKKPPIYFINPSHLQTRLFHSYRAAAFVLTRWCIGCLVRYPLCNSCRSLSWRALHLVLVCRSAGSCQRQLRQLGFYNWTYPIRINKGSGNFSKIGTLNRSVLQFYCFITYKARTKALGEFKPPPIQLNSAYAP